MSAPHPPPALNPAAPAPTVSAVVDARGLDQSGIGRYLREILLRLLTDSRLRRVILAGDPALLTRFLRGSEGADRAEVIPFAYPFYSPAAHLRWAALELQGRLRADVAFFPHYDVPLGARNPSNVVVVHDLIHFKLGYLFPATKRIVAGAVLRRAVRRSARVVVLSEATRRDLLERHPEVADRVTVIPNGVSASFASGSAAREVRGRSIASRQPYLLCVGNRKPHKNLRLAVEELARLVPERPDLRLVVVGRSFGDDGVGERATALGVREAVVELDEVSDEELRGLYRGAEALLFPSLYEGFGLPILEAMSFGVPVIASNRASIPEVVGSAGLIVDPDVAGAVAAAVTRLRSEPGLREQLVQAGLRRAAELSWERSAERTADLLVEVAARGKGS